jgi:hypothetical protein
LKKKADEEKTWVRHHVSGDRGWLEDNPDEPGVASVRLDRGGVATYRRYKAGPKGFSNEWPLDKDRRPITSYQVALCCYALDAEFMRAVKHGKAKDWIDLHQDMRNKWLKDGPEKDPTRKALFKAVHKVLDELTS